MQNVALQIIFNFKQVEKECLPEASGRFCALLRAWPGHMLPKNELMDIFYNGLTDESRTYRGC